VTATADTAWHALTAEDVEPVLGTDTSEGLTDSGGPWLVCAGLALALATVVELDKVRQRRRAVALG
jgi:hypothetical protein